ncbi:MAG: hydrolase [Proteobacteria bacterium]|nr:hydrolase [Pseudomonadota bacterium]
MSMSCILFFLLGCSSASQTWVEGEPLHHTREGFRNYPLIPKPGPTTRGFYWRRFWGSFFLPDVPRDHVLPEKQAIERFHAMKGKNTITWLGQSTFLIRMGGKTILTDPYLTEYASPFSVFGPRRFSSPGISLENLPSIDIIVVSHNHLDHLDEETVESIKNKKDVRVYVPLGIKSFFTERNYTQVEELDWHEQKSVDGLKLTALPTVHHSGRSMGDKDKTLWCSWAIASPSASVYFIGDSGYSPTIFKNIGLKHGPFDAALVTIGTYKTRESGPITHLYPHEAVQVGLEVKAKSIVAMHWGTIELSDEPHFEPPERFIRAAKKAGINEKRAWVMKIGETRELSSK